MIDTLSVTENIASQMGFTSCVSKLRSLLFLSRSYSFHRVNHLRLEKLVTPIFAVTRGHSPKWHKFVAITLSWPPTREVPWTTERCLSRYVIEIRSRMTYEATTWAYESEILRYPATIVEKTTTVNVAIAKSNEILRRYFANLISRLHRPKVKTPVT